MTKTCCRCQTSKVLTEFNASKRGTHGVHSICKQCKSIYMKQYALDGRLKTSVMKYKASEKGRNTIRSYTQSSINKLIQKRYRQSNGKGLCIAKLAKYRATQKQAMPSWIDVRTIRTIYSNCPDMLEVDHIIPLASRLVSGLHVPWNLQYLSRSDNAKKSNKFDGTYANLSWRSTK